MKHRHMLLTLRAKWQGSEVKTNLLTEGLLNEALSLGGYECGNEGPAATVK